MYYPSSALVQCACSISISPHRRESLVYSFRHSTSRRLLSHEVCRRAWAPWSRGWTLRHTRVRLPVLHCTLDSPSLYRGGRKGHTNAPFRSYGSGTLLRALSPCVGPASSTALMAVTRTVFTILGPYTQLGRRCEVSFIYFEYTCVCSVLLLAINDSFKIFI